MEHDVLFESDRSWADNLYTAAESTHQRDYEDASQGELVGFGESMASAKEEYHQDYNKGAPKHQKKVKKLNITLIMSKINIESTTHA